MKDPAEVFVDSGELSLDGLKQYYIELDEVTVSIS